MSDCQKNLRTNFTGSKLKKLDNNWPGWFSDMEISVEPGKEDEPVIVLKEPVVDQAALNGILNKIWNLNLTVLSVEQMERDH